MESRVQKGIPVLIMRYLMILTGSHESAALVEYVLENLKKRVSPNEPSRWGDIVATDVICLTKAFDNTHNDWRYFPGSATRLMAILYKGVSGVSGGVWGSGGESDRKRLTLRCCAAAAQCCPAPPLPSAGV